MSGRRQTDLCKSGKESTVNDPMLRSVNRNAKAGSPEDIYRHNPWRAPGNAPIADVCGLAGGTPWGANALEAGDYVNTTYAHHGTRGSTLPKMPTGTVWKIGGEATVSWNVRNNQCAPGPRPAFPESPADRLRSAFAQRRRSEYSPSNNGGLSPTSPLTLARCRPQYSYRLCPASELLSEECFQKHPLDFVETEQAILFANGSKHPIKGTFVNKGTQPEGSTWSMLPIESRASTFLSLSLSAHDLPHVPAERVTVWSSPRTASARAACRVRTTSCLARTPRRTAARSGRAAATTTATSPAPASPALRPPARTAPAVTTAAEAEPSSVRAIRPELVAHRAVC